MKRLLATCVVVTAAVCAAAPAHAFDTFGRLQAAESAKTFWDTAGPFSIIGSDCTNFVSQALWSGGMQPTADWRADSTDKSKLASDLYNPGPTRAAALADEFKNYMVRTGLATVSEVKWSDNTAGGAELADIIAYDWEGPADGRVDHLAMVTGFTDDGYPLVTQHSPARLNRGWSWDPGENNWIEFTHEGSRVYLLHLN